MSGSDETTTHLGVVSFLNSRPLIEGLADRPGVRLEFAVPAELPGMLRRGQVDVALVPVIDLAFEADAAGPWQRVSDACIGSDGRTLTVRVFSRVPAKKMTVLHVDDHSHTSVALARLIWARRYDRPLTLVSAGSVDDLEQCESVLLIGDKVVGTGLSGFDHEIDLGQAWKEWTGLPFVFAVWAAPAGTNGDEVARLLGEARDRGVARAFEIAAEMGPALGWPIDLAREYLTRRLLYKLTPAAREGMRRFLALAAEEGIITPNGELVG